MSKEASLMSVALSNDRKKSTELFGTWFASDESKLEKRVLALIDELPRKLDNLQNLLKEVRAKAALQHQEELKSYLSALSKEQIKELMGAQLIASEAASSVNGLAAFLMIDTYYI